MEDKKIVVFVSKNDEEFNRYVNGCGDRKRAASFPFPLNQSVSNNHSNTKMPGRAKTSSVSKSNGISFAEDTVFDNDEKQAAQKQGNKAQLDVEDQSCVVEYVFPLDSITEYYSNGVFVVVVRSSSKINELKAKSLTEGYSGPATETLLSLLAKLVQETFPDIESAINECEIHLLVHWGEITDLSEAEEAFNDVITRNNYARVFNCNKLNFNELSSRRRECFNVEAQEIKIPFTKGEVDALLQKFVLLNKYAGIKDLIAGYVFSKEINAAGMQTIKEFLSEGKFRDKLLAIISEPVLKWLLRKWPLFRDVVAAEPSKYAKVVAKLFDSRSDDDKDHLRAFLSQLLTEEMV